MVKDDDYYNLNGDPPEENTDGELNTANRPVLFRLAALITLLAFIGLVGATTFQSFKNASLAELVDESFRLKNNIENNLMQAVVQVQVVARKNGSSVTVEQKHGTGFNINSTGLIITNHHVVEDALNMVVEFPDGRVLKAVDWSSRPEYDLAVIKLDGTGLPVVTMDKRGAPQLGERIRVVGNPLSLNNIVVEGTVREYLTVAGSADLVFTLDAPVFPGNSGSPVYGQNGQVVGVVFATMRHSGSGIEKDLGLAIPIIEVLSLTG